MFENAPEDVAPQQGGVGHAVDARVRGAGLREGAGTRCRSRRRASRSPRSCPGPSGASSSGPAPATTCRSRRDRVRSGGPAWRAGLSVGRDRIDHVQLVRGDRVRKPVGRRLVGPAPVARRRRRARDRRRGEDDRCDGESDTGCFHSLNHRCSVKQIGAVSRPRTSGPRFSSRPAGTRSESGGRAGRLLPSAAGAALRAPGSPGRCGRSHRRPAEAPEAFGKVGLAPAQIDRIDAERDGVRVVEDQQAVLAEGCRPHPRRTPRVSWTPASVPSPA